jgi:hypothetical protein
MTRKHSQNSLRSTTAYRESSNRWIGRTLWRSIIRSGTAENKNRSCWQSPRFPFRLSKMPSENITPSVFGTRLKDAGQQSARQYHLLCSCSHFDGSRMLTCCVTPRQRRRPGIFPSCAFAFWAIRSMTLPTPTNGCTNLFPGTPP